MEYHNSNQSWVKPSNMERDYVELSSANSYPVDGYEARRMDSGLHLTAPKSNEDSDHGDAEPKDLPLWQALRRYPKVVGYCLALTIAVIGWGYDLAVVGAVPGVDSFLADFGEWNEREGQLIMPGIWLSLFLGLPQAGSALGNLTAGWLQDRIGRKFTLMTASVLSAIAVSIIFFSYLPQEVSSKRSMFTAGITFQGYTVGIIKVVCMTYVSENAPTAIRGSAMALFPTFNLLGQLIGSLVLFIINDMKGSTGYLGAFGSQWILSLAPFIISCLMPDSPAYFLRKDDAVNARRAATRLFAPKVDPDVMLKQFRDAIEEERALTAGLGYQALFQGTNLRRTLIVILANLLPNLFGFDLLSNASVFLKTIGLDSGTALLMLMAGIVCGMLGNAGGIWILTKVGRRSATLVTMSIAGLLWGALGIAGIWEGLTVGYVSAGIMIAVIIVCGLGCWPAGYAIMGETSSLRMRAKTQAVANLGSNIASVFMGFCLPMVFSVDQGNLKGKTGFIYLGTTAIAVALTWLWVPEMKGRSMLEIDRMFEMKLPTRKFKTWCMEENEAETPLQTDRERF